MKIEHTFILPVIAGSLAERIEQAGFFWVNADINTKKFPNTFLRKEELEITLVSFDQPLGYERVREKLKKEGYQAGSLYDLIDFQISFPNFYSQFPVYSVEKETELKYRGTVYAHPAMRFSGNSKKMKKELSLPWYTEEWPAGTLFICYKIVFP